MDPLVVPFMITLAPGSGLPSLSVTVPEKYAAVVEAIEADFEEHGIDSIRKNNYEIFEQNIEMVEAGLYEYRPDAGPDPLDMFDFPEDE
jgi:hypothetical protein